MAAAACRTEHSATLHCELRGIPETILPPDIGPYVKRLLRALLPDSDLLIDRVHRIPKPKFLPPTTARDALARVHFFHIKEADIHAIRCTPKLHEQFNSISLYTAL